MSEFDRFASTYTATVNDSVSFAGADATTAAKRKAEVLIDAVTRHVGSPDNLNALDVGCGIGLTDTFLVDRFASLTGVDMAADAVAIARERNPGVSYQAMTTTRLPFDDAAFSVTFAICVAHHVEPADRSTFAAELARVTRPGGVVAIFEHNPLNPLTRVAVNRCEFDEGVILLRRRESQLLLIGAGLNVVERRYILFSPFDSPVLNRLERHLGPIPIGAQHYVLARKPE